MLIERERLQPPSNGVMHRDDVRHSDIEQTIAVDIAHGAARGVECAAPNPGGRADIRECAVALVFE